MFHFGNGIVCEGEAMNSEIGTAAGKLYRFLDKNRSNALAISKIKEGTGLNGPVFDQAIGWLAREDKLKFERQGRNVLISLK